MATQRSKILFFSFLAILVIAIPLLAITFQIRINVTSSMPRGFYQSTQQQLHKGDLVEVCLSAPLAKFALERNYLSVGSCKERVEPVIKKVVAVGGDVVELTPKLIIVNGVVLPHSTTFLRDEDNRSIPAIARGRYKLSDTDVWLYGERDVKSWDSRYFGAINKASIRSILKPIFTW